jgi:hypothetical protein
MIVGRRRLDPKATRKQSWGRGSALFSAFVSSSLSESPSGQHYAVMPLMRSPSARIDSPGLFLPRRPKPPYSFADLP